ncbi:hypothetical protein B0H11DRAFT_1992452 [Mycena galericulata]|nr:hypothetical protein B0H11DRAFT_1992452 [Mycena galericulata]
MASGGQPTDDGGNSRASTSKTPSMWLDGEVKAMLSTLSEMKETHMSGNGFKPPSLGSSRNQGQRSQPRSQPEKGQAKMHEQVKLRMPRKLKKIYDLYVFVQKFSGSGWDDEAKHATNTEDYIQDFVKTYGDEYSRCFKSPCPYWIDLDSLYHNNINKATGANVEHLGKRKRTTRKKNSNTSVSNATAATPNASSSTHTPRTPLDPISTNLSTNGATPTQTGAAADESTFDDELDVDLPESIVNKGPKKRERAQTDDDASENENNGKTALKQQRSDSGGIARRNAEAGTQISRALDNLSTVMAQPLVTSEDLSHVNEVVEILKDKTLLPDDPRGRLYRAVSTALSRDSALARVFILEEDRTRRIGILEGILEDANLLDQ